MELAGNKLLEQLQSLEKSYLDKIGRLNDLESRNDELGREIERMNSKVLIPMSEIVELEYQLAKLRREAGKSAYLFP